jgi:hypothetical protein
MQVIRQVYERLKDSFVLEPRDLIEVTGKGPVEAWLLRLSRRDLIRCRRSLRRRIDVGTDQRPESELELLGLDMAELGTGRRQEALLDDVGEQRRF